MNLFELIEVIEWKGVNNSGFSDNFKCALRNLFAFRTWQLAPDSVCVRVLVNDMITYFKY